jgi:hypothetical protein
MKTLCVRFVVVVVVLVGCGDDSPTPPVQDLGPSEAGTADLGADASGEDLGADASGEDLGADASREDLGLDAGAACMSGTEVPCYTGPSGTRGVGLCTDGVLRCVDGMLGDTCYSEVLPTAEFCDGQDNDCNGVTDENLGAGCTVGVGACLQTGFRRCDDTCSATPLAPDAAFHTTPAPNGSWDWDCDGVVTEEATMSTAFPSALDFCLAQTCDETGVRHAEFPSTGYIGTVTSHCGAAFWILMPTAAGGSVCRSAAAAAPQPCTSVEAPALTMGTQACR